MGSYMYCTVYIYINMYAYLNYSWFFLLLFITTCTCIMHTLTQLNIKINLLLLHPTVYDTCFIVYIWYTPFSSLMKRPSCCWLTRDIFLLIKSNVHIDTTT
jgi:hypothetical protein